MKKLYISLLSVLLWLLNNNCIAQVTLQWANSESCSSGGIIVYDTTGYVTISGSVRMMDSAPWTKVVKYNVSGNQQWLKSCVGYNCGLSLDGAHNTYIASYTYWDWGEPKQMNLIKYNHSGIELWRINDTLFWYPDALRSMKGDYAGNSYMLMYRNRKYEVSKFNDTGSRMWISSFNAAGSSDNIPSAFTIDRAGNIVVIGESVINNSSIFNFVKYNSLGAEQWVTSYIPLTPINYYSLKIALDTAANIFISLITRDTAYVTDLATIKYNSAGAQLWARHYDLGSSSDELRQTTVDDSGNVISALDYKGIIKYNKSGVQQWFINTWVSAIVIDKNLNLYYTRSLNYSNFELFKYSSSGFYQWQIAYSPGSNSNYLGTSGIVLDTAFNIYVVGGYSYLTYPYIFVPASLTVKYSQLVGISSGSEKLPENFILHQNYPNPFNPITKIKFSLPAVGQRHAFDVRLIIYDALGREITTLVNEGLKPGTYEVEWDGSNNPSGVYFYKLTVYSSEHSKWSDEFSETRKMVLVK